MQVVNHHLRSSSLQFIIAQFKIAAAKKLGTQHTMKSKMVFTVAKVL